MCRRRAASPRCACRCTRRILLRPSPPVFARENGLRLIAPGANATEAGAAGAVLADNLAELFEKLKSAGNEAEREAAGADAHPSRPDGTSDRRRTIQVAAASVQRQHQGQPKKRSAGRRVSEHSKPGQFGKRANTGQTARFRVGCTRSECGPGYRDGCSLSLPRVCVRAWPPPRDGGVGTDGSPPGVIGLSAGPACVCPWPRWAARSFSRSPRRARARLHCSLLRSSLNPR